MGVVIFWRRRAPLASVAMVLACATALVAVWNPPDANLAPLCVLIVAPYAVARDSNLKRSLIGLIALLSWGVVVNATTSPSATNYITAILITAAAWGAGRWVLARRLLNQELTRKAERIEAERASRIRLAVADERTRIARELHALVAANVSAMVIQAETADLLLAEDLPAADAAMAAVEDTGRAALADMRRLLGVLRHTGEAPTLSPQPGVGQIYALVEATRRHGGTVELSVEGEPGPLPASVDLGIYRVLEEALGGDEVGAVRVLLRFAADDVELEITTSGGVRAPAWPTLAMSERVAICSGSIDANRHADATRLMATFPKQLEAVFA
jgi:signal transduction histidine kinase